MKNRNLLMNLYEAIGEFESRLQAIRDFPDTEGGDNRTDLEREMEPVMDKLWHMCRRHEDFFEATHQTHPHVFDADGDFIPFDSDTLREKRITSYRDAIEEFCKMHKISKTAFAKAYGCGATYLSRILSGEKAANHDKFVAAFYHLNFQPTVDAKWNWTFEKINQIL